MDIGQTEQSLVAHISAQRVGRSMWREKDFHGLLMQGSQKKDKCTVGAAM